MEEKTDIQKLLKERVKLDSRLQSEFSKKITIMFTDIKGSTSFYESRGDIDGRVMVHRHNEIVLPAIEESKGTLIKTIGDATMSLYDEPSNAIKAAMQIQKRLKAYNGGRPEGEQIHVRVGLNYGTGIVEETDVFGDVVNVASRVESLADAGEIMLTEDLYREVKSDDEFIFRYVDSIAVKGKSDPIKVFRLVWQNEDLHMGKTRKAVEAPQKKEGVFVLEASLAESTLKVSGFERSEGEERPVKSYKEVKFNSAKVKEYTKGITDLLNRANTRGKISNELLVKLKEYGGLLFDELVPGEIKERLAKTIEKILMLSMDDKLVHIPWELLFDGRDFLCQRFSMGRSVSTKQAVSAVTRAISRPLKMQILADPRGDLKASYEEGVSIKNEIGKLDDWLDVSLKTPAIKTDYVRAKIRNFDMVHYAGHADHNSASPEESGWILKDGKFKAEQIVSMTGVMPMPSLVFSNACQTGQTGEWKLSEDYEDRIFGLANAFLLSGVQHYIGTFWEIPDEAGSLFAVSFYNNLVDGLPIGEALRLARHSLIEKYGEDTIVWASYMLYGDPTTRYIAPDMDVKDETGRMSDKEVLVASGMRHGEDIIQFPQKNNTSRNVVFAVIGAALIAVLLIFAMKWNGTDKAVPVAAEKGTQTVGSEESKKRIDELVATLSAKYRQGHFGQAKAADWSRQPVTMVIMDIKTDNVASSERFAALLSQSLMTEKRISVVERELLAKLLEELKLGSSALADPLTALKIGKLLSAKIMVTGSIMPEGKGQVIMLRCIDAETTAIRKVISAEEPSKEISRDTVNNIGRQMAEWVKTDFPEKK